MTCKDATSGRRMIEVGERAPDFALPRGSDDDVVRFYSVVGGTPCLVVLSGGDPDAAGAAADRLRSHSKSTRVHLVVRSTVGADDFVDEGGHVHAAWGADSDGGPVVVLLDANLRVVAAVPADDVDTAVARVTGLVDALPTPHDDGLAARHAPVLFVQDAIMPDMADRLVASWRASSPPATGVETTADGRRLDALDHLQKRRRDHVVADPELLREVTDHVGRRVIPEVDKAFGYRATRFEGFKVGGYDAADQGFFAAHRDNLSPATVHRRFAMSCNLNDDYEGGELVFPEYGRQRYRPAAREALVFAGSHLHEVRPVTRGRRFVLLSFLFDQPRRT